MTEPSQRAMRLADLIVCKASYGDNLPLHAEHVRDWAVAVDAEFPAYLEIREALELVLNSLPEDWKEMAPASKGIGVFLKPAEIFKAAAALAKARKET